MKYIDAEKLVADIERQKKYLSESKLDERGAIIAYDIILSLITSLQQEQPEADFEVGYEQAEKELIPLINRLCKAILLGEDAADLARGIQAQIKAREE